MNRVLTPAILEILLHYHYRSNDYEVKSDTAMKGIETLLNLKLIEPYAPPSRPEASYIITDRGQAHVDGLCTLPLPEQKWISPIIKEI